MSNLRIIDYVLLAGLVILGVGQVALLRGQQTHLNLERAAPSSVTDLSAPPTALVPVIGTVKSVSGDSLSLEQGGGKTVAIALSPKAILVREGMPKSSGQYQEDMAAFEAQSLQLMQDPQKNADALRNLIAPSPYEEVSISLSDVKIGDNIQALGHEQENGSIDGIKISVMPPVGQ